VRQYEIVATAVTVLVMIYGIVVGIFIWRGSARGRSLARQYLVVRIAVAFLFCALSLAWAYYCFSALTAKRMAVTMAPLTLVEIAVALIWLGYFTYSKRVRNTYPTAYAVGMTNDQ
jgi:type IV secretory pathway VirB6-like protein